MLKKRFWALILAFILAFSCFSAVGAAESGSDYAGHWAQQSIDYCIERGYMVGYGNQIFKPNAEITRAEFSLMLWRSLESPRASKSSPFVDVKSDAWYKDAVDSLYELGITYGLDETHFGPDVGLTREMGVVMLARAYKVPDALDKNSYLEFVDGASISDWARASVAAYYAKGFASGNEKKEFSPSKRLTRAEMASLLYRIVEAAENGNAARPATWKEATPTATVSATPTIAVSVTPTPTASPNWPTPIPPSYSGGGTYIPPASTPTTAPSSPTGTPAATPTRTPTPTAPASPTEPAEAPSPSPSPNPSPSATPSPTEAPVNLAFRRAAWHSSALNYENTGHLTTDGIIGELSPNRIDYTSEVSTPNMWGGVDITYGTGQFTDETPVYSEWISKGSGEEWVYIDLGAQSDIESATVSWGADYAESYDIQISSDAKAWTSIAAGIEGAQDEAVETALSASARYIRVLCSSSSGSGYSIKEIEVKGYNDLEPFAASPLPEPEADGTQYLRGGNWKLQRASEVDADGAVLSGPDYDDSLWLAAEVPGTILTSYLEAGAIPDPNYDDWQFQISDTFFTADFWYRDNFEIPASNDGKSIFLNFDSINWKADVYFNGQRLPNSDPLKVNSIEGAFVRGRFDVTDYAKPGEVNYLAVKIYKNETPGLITTQGLAEGPLPNGGKLGADNPTMHAAVGWDWMPTIRGRDIGIFEDVFVSYSGGLEIIDPWIETDLDIRQTSSYVEVENLSYKTLITSPSALEAVSTPSALQLEPYQVIVDGNDNTQWVSSGLDNESFVIAFDEITTVGALEILWGVESGYGTAAEFDSRHPASFRVESSLDGENWVNFDAYPGAEIPGWFGGPPTIVGPNDGTDSFEGRSGSNIVEGPHTTYEMNFFGFVFPMTDYRFTGIKFLRLTLLSQNFYGGGVGRRPAMIKEIRIHAEDAQTVELSRSRIYSLDDSQANLTFRTEIANSSASSKTATVRGEITPGNVTFSGTVTVPAGQTVPIDISGILLSNPQLWWPNTYGEQPLYTARIEVSDASGASDTQEFSFGVREFTYPIDGGLLSIYCNGTRILAKGGNWGMDDALKRDTAEDYDNKVRLHAEENYTMIRNWVGMTNNKAFYEACDKYGILIWDDFWLANPVDGPDPTYPDMFLDNAKDKIKRNRAHAALTLYCGRNESSPPAYIDAGLALLTQEYDGTRTYFPNSAGAPVGSGGGYSVAAMPNNGGTGIKEYFNEVPNVTLRSECGIPNVPTLESLMKFLPEEKLWPINESWALHDWTYHMNGPANSYMDALKLYSDKGFITPVDTVQGQNPSASDPTFIQYKSDILNMVEEVGRLYTFEEFMKIADMINYENFKGVYEGITVKKSNGFLMWMSQSSWPSFMWQTYDYYLDTNAGYFGAKAANQATHAVWDPRDDTVVLSNMTPKTYSDVATEIKVYNLNGNLVYGQTVLTETLGPDAYGLVLNDLTDVFELSTTPLVFIKLTVKDSSGEVLGDNLYWHNYEDYMRYESLSSLPYVGLRTSTPDRQTAPKTGNELYSITITNSSATPALMIRVKTTNGDNGEQILPAFYSDNYISLMPGESKTITIEFDKKYLEGADPKFSLEGWNISPKNLN